MKIALAGTAKIAFAMVAALVLAAVTQPVSAQYPAKPVRIIVPVTTGGPSDLVARILGDKLSASMGKPFIIENRPGASMVVGSAVVAKSEPDGCTLLQAAANMAINPILMSDLPFDTIKDFAAVSLTHMTPYVFVVSSQLPVNSLAELFKYIRDNKGKITYGTTGPGSPQLLATLLLAQMVPLGEMTEIQYKGSSAAHPDLISNRITFMIDPLAASAPHIKSGSLRALAVSTPQRNPSFPNVPTATPREIIMKLNGELARTLNSPEIKKRFDDMGLVAKASSPEEFGAFLASEMGRWRAVLAKKP